MSNIIAFPDRRAERERQVVELEKEVEAWIGEGGSWLPYSEQIARWAVDPRGLSDMLRRFEAAGGRIAYERQTGRDGFNGVCAELAAEFLEWRRPAPPLTSSRVCRTLSTHPASGCIFRGHLSRHT